MADLAPRERVLLRQHQGTVLESVADTLLDECVRAADRMSAPVSRALVMLVPESGRPEVVLALMGEEAPWSDEAVERVLGLLADAADHVRERVAKHG